MVMVIDLAGGSLGLYYDRRSETWKWYNIERNKFASADEVYDLLRREYGLPPRLAKLLANTTHVSANLNPSHKKVALDSRLLTELERSYVSNFKFASRVLRDFFRDKGDAEAIRVVDFLKSALKTRKRGYGRGAHKINEGALDFYAFLAYDPNVKEALERLSDRDRAKVVVADGRVLVPTVLAKRLFPSSMLRESGMRFVIGVDRRLMSELLGYELRSDDLRKALTELKKELKRAVVRSIVRRKRSTVERRYPVLYRYVFAIDFTKAVIVDKNRFERAMNRILPEYNFYGNEEMPFPTFAFRSLNFTRAVSPQMAKRVIQQYYLNVWGIMIPFDAIMIDESGFGFAQEVAPEDTRARWIYEVDSKKLIRVI